MVYLLVDAIISSNAKIKSYMVEKEFLRFEWKCRSHSEQLAAGSMVFQPTSVNSLVNGMERTTDSGSAIEVATIRFGREQ
jgi:hypothetical protein